MHYFHLNQILEYIAKKEGKIFKVVSSRDFGVEEMLSFKALVPKDFEVEEISLITTEYGYYDFKILDNKGKNAAEGQIVILWESELYSTMDEKACCISSDGVDNGILVFEDFIKIPELISSEELIKIIEEL